MTDAYVAVGANIRPESNIVAALDKLIRQVCVAASSTFYRTAPWGQPGQPPFSNGVWHLQTDIEPRPLKFEVLRTIEAELGRQRSADKYAPRPIDLDIIVYGELVRHEGGLTIPDPEIRERPFLALPLWELAPGLVLPDRGDRLADLAIVRRPPLDLGLEPLPELTLTLKERIRDEQEAR